MNPEMRKAMEACRSLMPSGGPQRRGGFDDSAMNAFRTCMKDNGVEEVRGLDENDPKMAKALEKCRPLLPARPSAAPSA